MKASHEPNFSGSFHGSILNMDLDVIQMASIQSLHLSLSLPHLMDLLLKQNGHIKSEYTFIFTVITFTPYLIVVIKSVTLVIKI